MQPANIAGTTAFSEASIKEVDAVAFSEFEQIDEQVALIESFRQSFPTRERGKPVTDGEMESYGQDTAAI